jgi:hypothetical protein
MSGGEEYTVCNFDGKVHWTSLQCQCRKKGYGPICIHMVANQNVSSAPTLVDAAPVDPPQVLYKEEKLKSIINFDMSLTCSGIKKNGRTKNTVRERVERVKRKQNIVGKKSWKSQKKHWTIQKTIEDNSEYV